jgi:hypothetical protein
MKSFDKICKECNTEFLGTGPAAKYCTKCAELKVKESIARRYNRYVTKHKIIKARGVGRGNNQGSGETHHSFTTGIMCNFVSVRRKLKDERKNCERCNKDLSAATRYEWCLHHKDHDRKNNRESNFELLCKRCHQLEHNCQSAFLKRATTS